MKIRQLWLPEVKFTFLAIVFFASINLYSRFYIAAETRLSQNIENESAVVVPTPPVLSAELEPLLGQLQPAVASVETPAQLAVDPSAGRLGELQVSLKAVFLQDGERKAVLRLVDGNNAELKTVRLEDEVSGYRLTTLQQDSVIFQQGDKQVVLRLFKNNTAAGQPAQGT